jgi:hypothetical protein
MSSICLHCESRVAVAEARRQFGNLKEVEGPPLKAVTRGLMKRQQTDKIKCVL